ncbi:SCO family protein [Bacteriovoracaceae bacterium]|nr:SCO family protein [Bacteriovoracaceae bacterium]
MKKTIAIALSVLLFSGSLFSSEKWPENSIYQLESKWKNHLSKELKLEFLGGSVYILAMVYTGCKHTCPLIISKLMAIRRALPKSDQKKIKLVLVSFDSKNDTPKALASYKEKRGMDDNWVLLTGDRSGIRKLAAILGVSYKEESDGSFLHSNVFTTIDKNGVIAAKVEELNGNIEDMVTKIKTILQ